MTTLARANQGPGQRALWVTKAQAIHRAAQDTIAVRELEDHIAFQMRLLIDQHELLERQIAAAETRVAELLDGETARRLRTIPRVGAAVAAALMAEIGDILRFSEFDKLVAFAGVHAAERSSGKKGADPETSWHMAKTGSPYLRAALYRMAVVGLQHNPVIRAHYARKRGQGERARSLHEEGALDYLGCLAERSGLRREGRHGLTSGYGTSPGRRCASGRRQERGRAQAEEEAHGRIAGVPCLRRPQHRSESVGLP